MHPTGDDVLTTSRERLRAEANRLGVSLNDLTDPATFRKYLGRSPELTSVLDYFDSGAWRARKALLVPRDLLPFALHCEYLAWFRRTLADRAGRRADEAAAALVEDWPDKKVVWEKPAVELLVVKYRERLKEPNELGREWELRTGQEVVEVSLYGRHDWVIEVRIEADE